MYLFICYFRKKLNLIMECLLYALQHHQHHLQHFLSRSLPNNFLSAFYCIYKVTKSLPKTTQYRQHAPALKTAHMQTCFAACTSYIVIFRQQTESVLRTQQFINNGAAGMGSTSLHWSPSQWRCGEHILPHTSQVLAHRPRNMIWRKESTFQRDKQSTDWQPCCLDPLGCWETNDPGSGLQTLTL